MSCVSAFPLMLAVVSRHFVSSTRTVDFDLESIWSRLAEGSILIDCIARCSFVLHVADSSDQKIDDRVNRKELDIAIRVWARAQDSS